MPRQRKQKRLVPLLGAIAGGLAAGELKKQITGLPKKINTTKAQRVNATETGRRAASILRSADTSVVAAPVAVGTMMRGPSVTFSAAPIRGGLRGLRLQGRQIWGTLASSATSGSSNSAIFRPIGQTTAGTSVAKITFDPDDTATMPAPMTSLAEVFSRYALMRCRVVYTPATQTSVAGAIAFAVNTDAAFVQANTLNFLGIMEQSNAASCTPWSAASIDVPCDGALRFSSQSVADASLSYAEERQDHAFGMWVAANFTLTQPTDYGYFHVEYVIDFYEQQNGVNETSLLRAERRVSLLRAQFSARARDQLVARRGRCY